MGYKFTNPIGYVYNPNWTTGEKTARDKLNDAIGKWVTDETGAKNIYGDINTWDVSEITDFSELFWKKYDFNSDISNWDVSNGTDFSSMIWLSIGQNMQLIFRF